MPLFFPQIAAMGHFSQARSQIPFAGSCVRFASKACETCTQQQCARVFSCVREMWQQEPRLLGGKDCTWVCRNFSRQAKITHDTGLPGLLLTLCTQTHEKSQELAAFATGFCKSGQCPGCQTRHLAAMAMLPPTRHRLTPFRLCGTLPLDRTTCCNHH